MQAFGRNQKNMKPEYRISNKECRMMKLNLFIFFPSVFDIRYSIFCGSLLNFYASCTEVTA